MTDRRPAAVVTGGGGGIGTAVALELARRGVAVVAMDNGVSVQGEPLNEPTAAHTAELITAEGGVARASSASVTDRAAVRALFAGVVAEFGALDIVVNTAGILRYPPFLDASEQDWRDVLDVHLNGYLNVLSEAVPLMVTAGYGRIVGVTSGAGTVRAAGDAAAYACAKRAVAAVTWQLAGLLPEDVALNALSPLAATRMTTRAVTRGDTAQAAGAQAAGGLDLSGLPPARDMAPLAAFLASQEAGSCRGRVIFSAGPELSVVSPPRLLEAVRTRHTADFAASLDTLVPVVLGPAEAGQRSTGGANARFGPVFDQPGTSGPVPGPNPANCLVITGSAPLAASAAAALARCGLTAIDLSGRPLTTSSGQPSESAPSSSGPSSSGPSSSGPSSSGPSPSGPPVPLPVGFSAAAAAVERAAQAVGGIDAVIIAPGPFAASGPAVPSWQEMMTGYAATADHVMSHAGWLQAVARHAVRTSRPVRVMHLADATSPPLRASAQAVAQLARCATLLRPGLVDVFSIALETAEPADHEPVAHLTARLLWAGDATALRGAELVARPGWIGLRSHPAPVATASYGTSALPSWIPDWLRESVLPRAAYVPCAGPSTAYRQVKNQIVTEL